MLRSAVVAVDRDLLTRLARRAPWRVRVEPAAHGRSMPAAMVRCPVPLPLAANAFPMASVVSTRRTVSSWAAGSGCVRSHRTCSARRVGGPLRADTPHVAGPAVAVRTQRRAAVRATDVSGEQQPLDLRRTGHHGHRRFLHPCPSPSPSPSPPPPAPVRVDWRCAQRVLGRRRHDGADERRSVGRDDEPGTATTLGPGVCPVPAFLVTVWCRSSTRSTNLVGLLDDDPASRHRYP